ncbi:hypothetical protein IAQ61_003209 [Plenodomus lingam]|uniref:Predicted protein n=1 Tax=Leptosphaeria maculans (strain JN3 / isolate v23.1.3 / race Av1-4-5-6-7-8) TaxID=985895 RepID=E5ADT8_LEPMJ|nr:predicted protein [Plenodomus lingam JN3]KAH9875745.1 hypothetical protein IAQ61_003209 [Plenodomus lingam]CBY01377.1 predicted protein [Plenodomus lingam JN3]
MERYEETSQLVVNKDECQILRYMRNQETKFEETKAKLKDDSKFDKTLILSVSDGTDYTGRKDLEHWEIAANDIVHASFRSVSAGLKRLRKDIIETCDHIERIQVHGCNSGSKDPARLCQDQAVQTEKIRIPGPRVQGTQAVDNENIRRIHQDHAVQTDDIKMPDAHERGMQSIAMQKKDAQTQASRTDFVQKRDTQAQTAPFNEATISSTQTETSPHNIDTQQPSSWNSFRDKFLSSFVKQVTLTVDAAKMSLEDKLELQRQFPGVSLMPLQPEFTAEPELEPNPRFQQTSKKMAVSDRLTTTNKPPVLEIPKKSRRDSQDSVINPDLDDGIQSRLQTQTPTSGSSSSSILDYADELGLDLSGQMRQVVSLMYSGLRKRATIASYRLYRKRIGTAEDFYYALLNLYILTFRREEHDFAYTVLLRFQNTMCPENSSMPPVQLALRAFKFLPQHAPFCQWIAIVYCFLWPTRVEGPYTEFDEEYKEFDVETKAKLLYEVAYYRDPYVYGNDTGVISSWCDVHDHAHDNPEQIARCRNMREETDINEKEVGERERRRLKELYKVGFRKIDPRDASYVRSDYTGVDAVRGKKRKVEDEDERIDQNMLGEVEASGDSSTKRKRVKSSGKVGEKSVGW